MDKEQISRPLPSFTLFSNLPSEIRLLIWHHSLQPRTHEITYDTLFHHGFNSYHSSPTILQINQESRSFGLAHYTLCFGSTFQPPSIYFNFALDTVYLPASIKFHIPHFFGILSRSEIENLKYLALSAPIFPHSSWDPVEFSGPLKRVVQEMTGLRDLMIVYSLSELMFPARIQEDPDREMEFVDGLPLGGPEIVVRELPKKDEWRSMGFDSWQVRKMRPVYGWRGEWPVFAKGEGRKIGRRIDFGDAENDGAWDGVLDYALEGMVLNDDDEDDGWMRVVDGG
jgi:2EXR family